MNTPAPESKLPLDDVMLAMDVVDTLRHRQDLVTRELHGDAREAQLIQRLRDVYHNQGIEVPDHILREGVKALAESRFVYTAPRGGFGVFLARLYVTRGRWGRWAGGLALALVVAVSAYSFVYLPYQASQAERTRAELADVLPARMDALYQVIFEETKVQTAVERAEELRARGKIASAEGDRVRAQEAVTALEALRDALRQEYSLRVVNREGVRSGFWTFPEVNSDATNYYIVVEAVDTNDKPIKLPILNEETDTLEMVDMWGLRVPEAVYRGVEADKLDDGIIQRNIVGVKEYGYLDTDYMVPVTGGAVTRW